MRVEDPSSDEGAMSVQLRIGFDIPLEPVTVNFYISGVFMYFSTQNSPIVTVSQYLQSYGIEHTAVAPQELRSHIKYISKIKSLPERVTIIPETDSFVLFKLATTPPINSIPANVNSVNENLEISWFDGIFNHSYPLNFPYCVALLESDMPFVASEHSWELISDNSRLPIIAGRAKLNYDGFIEIYTSKPQLIDASPLKGLFRIDDSRFGLPIKYAAILNNLPGFLWEGPRVNSSDIELVETLNVQLSDSLREDLESILPEIIQNKSLAISRPSGAGRRILALASLFHLKAYPILIVCPPSNIWVWQRHCDLIGLEHSVARIESDVTIVTYRDFAAGAKIPRLQSVIFDDLAGNEAFSASKELKRLDAYQDVIRISVDSKWPSDYFSQVKLLSVIKPTEFGEDLPFSYRYSSNQRFIEHSSIYLSNNFNAFASSPLFKRSSVSNLSLSDDQIESIKSILENTILDPTTALLQLIEITTAGPPQSISPKVSSASEDARKYLNRGYSVAILCRSSRTGTLIRSLLRPLNVIISEGNRLTAVKGQAQIIYFSENIPTLFDFDIVLVLDYPWNSASLEGSIGNASADNGPRLVRVYHISESIDDRLSLLAARRRELGYLGNTEKPSLEEIAFLLAPRWDD